MRSFISADSFAFAMEVASLVIALYDPGRPEDILISLRYL